MTQRLSLHFVTMYATILAMTDRKTDKKSRTFFLHRFTLLAMGAGTILSVFVVKFASAARCRAAVSRLTLDLVVIPTNTIR